MIHIEASPKLSLVPGIVHGFFGRQGGVSEGYASSLNCSFKVGDAKDAVLINRNRALAALGLEEQVLAIPNLVHSDRAIIFNEMMMPAESIDADGIITHGYAVLGVTYADCLPVLMASSDGQIVVAVHAGWRGIIQGILINTCMMLEKYYGKKELVVALGPVISPHSFIVKDEVFEKFKQKWPRFVRGQERQGSVDLRGIAHQQLLDCGVGHVDIVGGFTDSDETKYFSHRRDHGQTGRHVALIARR